MDERYTGKNYRNRTGSSTNKDSEKDFVFDWKSLDMETSHTRSNTSSYRNTGRNNNRSAAASQSTATPKSAVTYKSTARKNGRTQTMSEKDILMFGDEEQESGTFDGRKNHTSQRSGHYGRSVTKKSNPVGDILAGVVSAVGGLFTGIVSAVSGLIKKEKSPRRVSAHNPEADSSRDSRTGSSARKRRKKNTKRVIRAWAMRILFGLAVLFVLALIFFGLGSLIHRFQDRPHNSGNYPEYVDEQLLTINKYSRPGQSTDTIRNIVIHSTTESGVSAHDVRKYYENLATSQETRLSSNFIVGMDGEVIVCIPDGEMSYCSNTMNRDCVAVEYCHEEISGEMTEETYNSLVNITAWLCKKYKLKTSDIIRHYDINKRTCPPYFVDNEDSWNQFRKDVAKAMKNI